MNLDDILSKASLAERTERVCLNAALLGEWEEAERLASTAEQAATARAEKGTGMLTDGKEVAKYRKAADALKKQVEEQAVEMRFRALTFAAYNALLVKHPPRKDHQADRVYGFNADTLFPELVRASLVEPKVSDEQWDRLLGVLNDRTWDRVASAALHVNRGEDSDVPF